MHPFHRTELIVGRRGYARLQKASVLVVGLGGVGSYAAEAIARSGVGRIGLVDFDDVCLTNLNRQIHSFRRTVGLPKSELMEQRVRAINPRADVTSWYRFFEDGTSDEMLEPGWDWVIDCIDNVTAKIHLLQTVPDRARVVTALGAGSKLDPTRVRVDPLEKTRIDPLARIIRKRLRQRGASLDGITAVWSDEPPVELDNDVADAFRCICPGGNNEHHSCGTRNVIQGTVAFLPSVFGLMAAGVVINALIDRPLAGTAAPREIPA